MLLFSWLLRYLTGQHLIFWLDKGDPPQPPAPPAPIDPAVAIRAQAAALPGVVGPRGSQIYSGDPSTPGSFRLTETLAPSEQRQLEGRNRLAESMLGRVESMPQFEFRGAEDPTSNAVYQAGKVRLDRSSEEQRGALEQRMSNQGLPLGSTAYSDEMDRFERGRADAEQQLSAGSLGQGYQQALGTRQQGFSELSAILGMQPSMPGAGGSPIDAASPHAQQAQQQQAQYQQAYGAYNNAYNADVSRSNAGIGSMAVIASAFI